MPKWFAVFCAPREEHRVERKLRDLGYETFFPHTVEIVPQSRYKSRFVKMAYFNRYLFVCFRPERAHLESAYQVNDATGARLVCSGTDAAGYKVPYPVPSRVVEKLQKLCDPLGMMHEVKGRRGVNNAWTFEAMDRVSIDDAKGALRGLKGVIESVDGAGAKLKVRLDRPVLGQDVVAIKASDVVGLEKPRARV